MNCLRVVTLYDNEKKYLLKARHCDLNNVTIALIVNNVWAKYDVTVDQCNQRHRGTDHGLTWSGESELSADAFLSILAAVLSVLQLLWYSDFAFSTFCKSFAHGFCAFLNASSISFRSFSVIIDCNIEPDPTVQHINDNYENLRGKRNFSFFFMRKIDRQKTV